MNKIIIYLLTTINLLSIILSCQKAPQLTITSSPTVELSVDGGSETITFTANRAWTISASDSWISISPKSGEASKDLVTVRVSCNANTTYEDRTAMVILKMEDQTQIVTIKQPANLDLIVQAHSYEMAAKGGNLEIDVRANVRYEISINADWIRLVETKGLTTNTLLFNVSTNNSSEMRSATITFSGSGFLQTITVNQLGQEKQEIPKGATDLGVVITMEDGGTYNLYWAECNIGANTPVEFGDYFSWGETETKDEYNWTDYKWFVGPHIQVNKYCPIDKDEYWKGSGNPDGKTILDSVDDAALKELGGKWRMPTDIEWTELINQCTWAWIIKDGIRGYEVASKQEGNTNSIFLPAAGYKVEARLNDVESYGRYWSSSLSSLVPSNALSLTFNSTNVYISADMRNCGFPIRPVTE